MKDALYYRNEAEQNFIKGYNCTQSVVLAFSELIDMDKSALLRMVSPLGGGMGRLREVCGAVSGMFILLGIFFGYDDPQNKTAKTELYKKVQELAFLFEQKNRFIVCKDLLGLNGRSSFVPDERTADYYKKRPCKELIGDAAEIFSLFLMNNNAIL